MIKEMGSDALTLSPRLFRLGLALKIVTFAVLGLLMLIPVAMSVQAGIYDSCVDDALAGWGMWATFVIFVGSRPRPRDVALTVGLAMVLRAAYDVAVGERGYPGSLILALGPFLGVASLVPLVIRSLGPPSEQRTNCRNSLAIIALLNYIGVCLNFYISFARMVLPRKLDYFLYNFDGSLGFQPSFLAGRLLKAIPPLEAVEGTVYDSLGFWFGLIYAVHAGSKLRHRVSFPRLFGAKALAGFWLYFLFPAMGPKHAFPSFPAAAGAVHSAAVALSGVPNAMPSLHFAAALLVCWLSKPWKWLYPITTAFAVLTALATLGLGEHYVVDLVVAVPYTLAVFAFGAETPEKRRPMMVASALVVGWILYLHTGWYFGPLSWVLMAATIAISLRMKQRLQVWNRAAGPAGGAPPEEPACEAADERDLRAQPAANG